jgi:hypothetical protein
MEPSGEGETIVVRGSEKAMPARVAPRIVASRPSTVLGSGSRIEFARIKRSVRGVNIDLQHITTSASLVETGRFSLFKFGSEINGRLREQIRTSLRSD